MRDGQGKLWIDWVKDGKDGELWKDGNVNWVEAKNIRLTLSRQEFDSRVSKLKSKI